MALPSALVLVSLIPFDPSDSVLDDKKLVSVLLPSPNLQIITNIGPVPCKTKFAAFPSIPPSKNFFLPTFVSRHCLK